MSDQDILNIFEKIEVYKDLNMSYILNYLLLN